MSTNTRRHDAAAAGQASAASRPSERASGTRGLGTEAITELATSEPSSSRFPSVSSRAFGADLAELPDDAAQLLAGRRYVAWRNQVRASRERRLQLRHIAGRVSVDQRVARCGGSIVWDRTEAEIKVDHDRFGRPQVGVTNLVRCQRPHKCPDCAAKVRDVRGEMVASYARRWLQAGGSLAFCTFTLARKQGEPMTTATRALRKVLSRFTRLVNDAGWNQRAEVVGFIESLEWTISTEWDGSGHPHAMRLVFFRDQTTLGDWHYRLAPLWVKAASDCGRRASYDYGLNVKHPEMSEGGSIEVLSDYFTKGASAWGAEREMTRGDVKESRTDESVAPFELLAQIETSGDLSWSSPLVRTWQEYERACERVPIARKSRGLAVVINEMSGQHRDVYGAELVTETVEDTEDTEDTDLAEEEVLPELEGATVAKLRRPAVAFIQRHRAWTELYRIVEDLAWWELETGTAPDYVAAVRALLDGLGAPSDLLADVTEPDA